MLQWYIHALADPICNHIDYTTRVAILGAVAKDGLNTPFLVIMLGEVNTHFWCRYRELTPPGGDVEKCQQAFLAPLPRTSPLLVAMLRNANKHFLASLPETNPSWWRR